ncbi:MAG TPA: SIMPL domain-containing protein [Candidatus Binataceae bacterium]|nr:SIMPL domain-containing protein [Candidatus Binataceae bacterium]
MGSRIAIASILVLIAFPLAAFAQPSGEAPSVRAIVVEGHGEAAANPDIADLNLAIEFHAPTAAEASSRNAALAAKVVSALESKLGDKGKVWTGGYSLTPEYDERQKREKPNIVGYKAENSITVETADMAILGSLIDSAVAAGANRVNYVNFSLKDDTKARSEAIAKASRDATAQAQALAAALGVRLKRIIKASTESAERPVRIAQGIGAVMAMAPTPIEPSQLTVPATVSLTYEIE